MSGGGGGGCINRQRSREVFCHYRVLLNRGHAPVLFQTNCIYGENGLLAAFRQLCSCTLSLAAQFLDKDRLVLLGSIPWLL